MGIFRFVGSILLFVVRAIKIVFVLCGLLLVFGAVFYLFLDDLPLGEPSAILRAPSAEPILDMHVHVAGLGYGDSGCFISDSLKKSYKFYIYQYAMNVSEEESARLGDSIIFKHLDEQLRAAEHVKQAVVVALDGVIKPNGELDKERTEVYVPNEFVAAEVKKYTTMLYGASINPHRRDALQRLVAAKDEGAVLIKWLPSIMDIDPGDERLRSFYLALVELDMPLLIHTGHENSFTQADDKLSDPLRLELPLSLGVTVIAAHIASAGSHEGESNYERLASLFAKYPNLYTDISSLTQINRFTFLPAALKRPEIVERMIYGSDWPLQFFPLVSPFYFARELRPADMRYINGIKNQFDRDYLLKRSLGTPEDVFKRTKELLLNRKAMAEIVKEKLGTHPTGK